MYDEITFSPERRIGFLLLVRSSVWQSLSVGRHHWSFIFAVISEVKVGRGQNTWSFWHWSLSCNNLKQCSIPAVKAEFIYCAFATAIHPLEANAIQEALKSCVYQVKQSVLLLHVLETVLSYAFSVVLWNLCRAQSTSLFLFLYTSESNVMCEFVIGIPVAYSPDSDTCIILTCSLDSRESLNEQKWDLSLDYWAEQPGSKFNRNLSAANWPS